MNVKKIPKHKILEILRLYYNGITQIKRIAEIVNCSDTTISKEIDNSFKIKINYKEDFTIKESIMNYD